VKTKCRPLVFLALAGCADTRPEHFDEAQREAVKNSMQSSTYSPVASDKAVLRAVKKSFFDKTTITSSFGGIKDESGNRISTMNGLLSKSVLNLDPGVYTVFVTCQAPGLYNNHLLKINLSGGSDSTIFCMPKPVKLVGSLNLLAAFYAFIADSNKFEEAQLQHRKEIEAGTISCGENCQELPL